MIIAVDIDEVLADTSNTFIDYYNKKTGNSLEHNSIKTYEWWEDLGDEREIVFDLFNEMILKEFKLNKKEGSFDVIEKLSKIHEIVAVTSRPKFLEGATTKWIDDNFNGMIKNVYFSSGARKDVDDEKNGDTKTAICKRIGADILIEDQMRLAPDNLKNGLRVLLFDYPWNKEVEENSHIIRVKSWKEIEKIVMEN